MSYQATPRVKHLAFYPIKSAAGIEVQEAILDKGGLAVGRYRDHQFMVVRAQADDAEIYHFLTQRDRSDMSLIKPRFINDIVELTWKGENPIILPPDRNRGRQMAVKIWNDTCYAVDQGNKLAEWISDYLGVSARLVKAGGQFSRKADQDYMSNDNPLRFHDGYPLHWFAIESVDELSGIAGQNIPWQSFRPQMVIEGMRAQFEHVIYSGRVADIPFVDPKPCGRCRVTLVDQETGEVRLKEPLKSLSTYKNWRSLDGDRLVIFGENMLPFGEGTIKVGDEMTKLKYRNPGLLYGKNV